jgi:hypothetical protein
VRTSIDRPSNNYALYLVVVRTCVCCSAYYSFPDCIHLFCTCLCWGPCSGTPLRLRRLHSLPPQQLEGETSCGPLSAPWWPENTSDVLLMVVACRHKGWLTKPNPSGLQGVCGVCMRLGGRRCAICSGSLVGRNALEGHGGV